MSRTNYPIVNKWSFPLPSWLFFEKSLKIAEINICKETDPDNTACKDSIVVGCVHQEPTDYGTDTGVVQVPNLAGTGITSHVGLNRLQTSSIVAVYNDLLQTLGITDHADNIFGVFLLGDTNNGQILDRCTWTNTNGDINADNCAENPSNPFDLYLQNGFVDAQTIGGKDAVCTSCSAESDRNKIFDMTQAFPEDGTWIRDPAKDLDHVLIQNGYCKNFKDVAFSREFMADVVPIDAYGYSGTVPASDHYGVSLNIEFKNNGGGTCGQGNCCAALGESEKSEESGHLGDLDHNYTQNPTQFVFISVFCALTAAIAICVFMLLKCTSRGDDQYPPLKMVNIHSGDGSQELHGLK
eukprot:952051_1